MQAARIAIVDDDPLFVEYLATFLKSRGYETVVFNNGPALLGSLSGRSAPDVVLLDVLMPTMNGLETLKALRTASPSLPVIMLSGQQVPATIVDAVRLGAIDYVVKSDESAALHDAALEAAINRALEHTSLTSEVARLTAQIADSPDGTQVCWGTGPSMRSVLTMIERVADSDVSVLLTGESGVGKEVIARELHRRSTRRTRPFVKVNCAALPSELLESELFGHERGAFTGAQATRVGKFEFASGGTILLDEIGEMPVALQAKLLHVLQDRAFTKLGSNRPVEIDVRVIARHQSRSDDDDPGRPVPRGSLLPAAGHRDPRAAASRSARGDSDARRVLPPAVRRTLRPAAAQAVAGAALRARRVPVAGQHPRARERDEALRDPARRRPAARGALARARSANRAGGDRRAGRRANGGRDRAGLATPGGRPGSAAPTARQSTPAARAPSCPISRAPPRFPPSAKPSSTRSITSAGIAAKRPRSWASATRRCSTR